MTRPFRFGVVTPVLTDLPAWRDRVRRIADAGYSTLLMPDVPSWQPAPAPTLAFAAAQTDLRVGTWVYASPFRPAWSIAWEAHSLSVLTEGRFELGIGTGRPGIEDELRTLGIPVTPPPERLAVVRQAVATLRDLDGPDLHTPVVMAVRGPRAQALATEVADTVTIAAMPDDSRADVARRARAFRAVRNVGIAQDAGTAGDAWTAQDAEAERDAGTARPAEAAQHAEAERDVELALHVPVVGDRVAPFMAPPDIDTAALREADSLAYLPDDPAAAAEEIHRRREEIGYSYFVFGADFAERLAPVVAELSGR